MPSQHNCVICAVPVRVLLPTLGSVSGVQRTFGDFLYGLRQARGWSLREAARRAGIAFSRLGEIERGIDQHTGKPFQPSYLMVCRIAKAYDYPVDELLRMAGHDPVPELTPEEWRMLGAFRRLEHPHREAVVDILEKPYLIDRLLTEIRQYADTPKE